LSSYVLITGSTGGIGQALAEEFIRQSYPLVLVSRDAERLAAQKQALAARGADVQVIVQDLTRPEAPEQLDAELRARGLEIEILVHNAGFYEVGEFSATDLNRELGMIQLHINFLTHFTKLMLPAMQARGNGHILLLGSIASFIPGPFNLVYCATKAYVLSFGEALAEELAGQNITVTVVCPGPVATPFAQKVNFGESKMFSEHLLKPEQVARAAGRAMRRGQRVMVVGWRTRLYVFLIRLTPRRLVAAIVNRMMRA
jgi:short-subunit dehydrogenase